MKKGEDIRLLVILYITWTWNNVTLQMFDFELWQGIQTKNPFG